MKKTTHDNVLKLTAERLRREPMTYTVEFMHTHDDFRFIVHDVQDDHRSRLAVADAFESAAASLREKEVELKGSGVDE